LMLLVPVSSALMDSYRDQERLLWEQLSGLVTDAAWLESYAAAAMLKVKETMQVGASIGEGGGEVGGLQGREFVFLLGGGGVWQ
jgi:hypothetical protein